MFQLEIPKYSENTIYEYPDDGGEPKVVTTYEPEMGYIPPPKRDVIEFLCLVNPAAPAPDVLIYFYEKVQYDSMIASEPSYYDMTSHEREALAIRNARHKVYPYFQCVVLLAVCAAATAVFLRRDLK